MDNEDARRLSPTEQHERRRQVIRAYKRKVNKRQIARDVGLSYSATCKIIDRYEAEGMAALAPRKRGRSHGDKRVLSAEQEAQIRKTICDHRPEQLKMDFALWSRAAVRALIEREFKVGLHLRSVGKYLQRWGFTPQKPITHAAGSLIPSTLRNSTTSEPPSVIRCIWGVTERTSCTVPTALSVRGLGAVSGMVASPGCRNQQLQSDEG